MVSECGTQYGHRSGYGGRISKEIVTWIWATARHNALQCECVVASPIPCKFGGYPGGERASANDGLRILIKYH